MGGWPASPPGLLRSALTPGPSSSGTVEAEQLLGATGTRAVLCTHLHHPPANQEPFPDGHPSGVLSGNSATGAPLTGAAAAPTTPRQESL